MKRALKSRRVRRPPEDDVATTHARLLKAARRRFAQHGFHGTSVREITAEAGVNLGAINHYFATKELLYVHVLNQVVGPIGTRVEWAVRGDHAPIDKIERVVRAFFAHIQANPDMPAFMVREMAAGTEPSAPIVQTIRRALPALVGVIQAGQADGSIRAGDPLLLALSTMSQPVYLYLARGAIGAATGLKVADPAMHDRIVEHAVRTVRAALEQR